MVRISKGCERSTDMEGGCYGGAINTAQRGKPTHVNARS